MPALTPTSRPTGSTRGFTTVDPERQGVLACLSMLPRNELRTSHVAARTATQGFGSVPGQPPRGAPALKGTRAP